MRPRFSRAMPGTHDRWRGRPSALKIRAGFTLIEVLGALAVLGVVMLLLGQGLRFGIDAWTRQTRILATGDDIEPVERLLRRVIGRIDPGGMHGLSPEFHGTPHAVAFTSILPPEALPSREADIALAVRPGVGLILSWRPHVRGSTGGPDSLVTRAILPGVTGLDLAYMGAGGIWLSGWDEKGLPKLIRLHLTFASGGGKTWPDIFIAPMRDVWRP